MSDYCEIVNIIPQYLGTCWFNAILMSYLYSQGASRVFRETIISDKWEESNNPLKIALFNILSYINRIRLFPDLREYHKRLFQDYLNKVRPEQMLLKTAESDKELLDFLKQRNKQIILYLGYYSKFLPLFLEILGISYLSIFIDKDNNQHKRGNENPEIIVLQDFKLYPSTPLKEHQLFSGSLKINDDYEELELIGVKYKLDSCLLTDYNKIEHSIVGITCGDKRYVYNGWDDGFCPLIPFDWSINNKTEFCLNTKKCELLDLKDTNYTQKQKKLRSFEKDLCFSFNKGYRLLVYVRVKEEELNLRTKIKGFKLDIRQIKKKIKNQGLFNSIRSLFKEKKKDAITSMVDIKSIKSIKNNNCIINDIYLYLNENRNINSFLKKIEIETLKDILKDFETNDKKKLIDLINKLLETDELFTIEFLKELKLKSLRDLYKNIDDDFKTIFCKKKEFLIDNKQFLTDEFINSLKGIKYNSLKDKDLFEENLEKLNNIELDYLYKMFEVYNNELYK